ncbi:MAG: 23S rRNA (guanosine(2251)-2'-O)-methyltransferase RlmB [Alphaproteobacteria bacterium]|nr:23S rRNA (guanosine(2251)-2'-O)-methyltransferase RlmB [Alphaproteobacteria bacterium]
MSKNFKQNNRNDKHLNNNKKESNKNNNNTKGIWLYGFHPVVSALKNPNRKINRVLVTKETLNELQKEIGQSIEFEIATKQEIEQIIGFEAVHQGICAQVQPLPDYYISDIPDKEKSVLILLDQVTDPHNVGAILRSACAFGADAVLLTEKNAPEATGTLAKSASGMLEHVPLIPVVNIARTMDELKKRGYWCVGMDGNAKDTLHNADLPKKIVLVMGSEGFGLRRLTQENCDFMVKLPMDPKVESLNVSVATAIALYDLKTRE